MQYEVEIPQMPELIATLERAGGDAVPLMSAAVKNATTMIQSLARSAAPHVTGTMQRSILEEATAETGRVYVDVPYGVYVEEGTRPHIIQAKNASVLANKKANLIFGRIVHHPGSKPNPFFARAIETAAAPINEIFNQVADIIMNELIGEGSL